MARFLDTLDEYELIYNNIGLKTIKISRNFKSNLTHLFTLYKINLIGKSGNIYKADSIYCCCDFYIIDIIQTDKRFLFRDADFTQSLDVYIYYQDI